MTENKDSFAAGILRRLTRLVIRNRSVFIWPQVVFAAVCVFYTFSHLEFYPDRDALVGTDKEYHRNFLEYLSDFRDTGDLVAVVESENQEKNREFVERLAARLLERTNIFSEVFYKGDLVELGPKALLFLEEDELKELESTLEEFTPFIEKFSQTSGLVSLFSQINQEFVSAANQSEEEVQSLLKGLPALERVLKKAEQSLMLQGLPVSPGLTSLFGADEEAESSQYVTIGNGQFYLVSTRPVARSEQALAVKTLRQLVRQTQEEIVGVNAGVTGEPVLIVDELKQAQRDMTVASIASIIFVAAVFIFGYHETGRPIKATLCLVIGLAYTMGYTTLAIGHLNILTITFTPILIGLAIDFGVHLISRYEEEIRHGKSVEAAIEHAVVHTGQGIFTGALTTAGAFFAMAFTDFDGVEEMGIITGGGMLICLVPMMTMLPALLIRGSQNIIDHKEPVPSYWPEVGKRKRLEQFWLQRPGTCLWAGALLAALAISYAPKVQFDYNILNLQTKALPAVVLQNRLMENSDRSLIFAASIADTSKEATELEKQFEPLSSVAMVRTLAPLFEPQPREKLDRIRHIADLAGAIQFKGRGDSPVDTQELNQILWGFQGYLRQAMLELEDENRPDIFVSVESLYEATVRFRQRLLNAGDDASRVLARYQYALFSDVRRTFETLANQDSSGAMEAEDLPLSLRDRFISKSGKHLVQVFPSGNIWNRQVQELFIQQTRLIDPKITGTPVQLYEYTKLLTDSYVEAAWYALATITVMTLFHFRSIVALLLALLPVAVGALFTVGWMGFAGIAFNPANIMILPLVVGIGVTNGVHMLNRFSEEAHPNLLSSSTGKAVLVSGCTTIGGFASLILAKHQGIASLGIIMSAGVAACMLSALVFLPAILSILTRRGWKFGPHSKID